MGRALAQINAAPADALMNKRLSWLMCVFVTGVAACGSALLI